jgi:uncharacterized 2Fe-2S/4Fe-4S cluster protein (DUF4445 family)
MMKPSLQDKKQYFTVDLQPSGRRVQVAAGVTLLEAIQKAGIDLVASCGGAGFCGTCLVKVVQGSVTAVSSIEKEVLEEKHLKQNLRLACQTGVQSDVRIFIPSESLTGAQQLQVEGDGSEFIFHPAVIPLDLKLTKPSIHDQNADLSRIDTALAAKGFFQLTISPGSAAFLSGFLRQHDWECRLALVSHEKDTELVGCLPWGEPLLGLAMDIGSTKIALYLVNLESGGTLVTRGLMNPQLAYGEDVISRIAFADRSEENRQMLQKILVNTINESILEMCTSCGGKVEEIVDLVMVGNTAIHHFFCGLPVEQLGCAPYIPAVQKAMRFPATEVGLKISPFASVYIPPNIAGYVGADHVSALTITHAFDQEVTSVLVDIGTNTEISLLHQGQIYSCSCASGPAFEGAHIHNGIRAIPGAIEKVVINADQIQVFTIGGKAPLGLCGSGILSAIAEMCRTGLIDKRGVIQRGNRHEFELVSKEQSANGEPIVITRKDINEIQLAKGAIRSGIEVLLKHARLDASQVQRWIIAGAFGTHLDLGAALRVGIFPDQPLERFHQVGNAAGVGARQMLLSTDQRQLATNILDRVHYIELTMEENFQNIYVESLFFPTLID